jgi:hypothetical protein
VTLKRKAPIQRGRMKRKSRKPSETRRIYGPPARRKFVRDLPCFACLSLSPVFGMVTAGSCHNAHSVTGGTGRKADAETIVPLCASHHRRYDEHQKPFDTEAAREAVKQYAVEVEAAWQRELAKKKVAA